MPDSRTPETAPSGRPAGAPAEQGVNDEPEAVEAPLNRAERRAHAKGRKPAEAKHKSRITGHQKLGGGPRQWTNRRGGG